MMKYHLFNLFQTHQLKETDLTSQELLGITLVINSLSSNHLPAFD